MVGVVIFTICLAAKIENECALSQNLTVSPQN